MKTLEELFEEYQSFSLHTFKKSTAMSSLLHLSREIEELKNELGTKSENKAIEIIDCIMCLLSVAAREGIGVNALAAAFDKKLSIQVNRDWRYNGDGTYSHIKNEVDHHTITASDLYNTKIRVTPEESERVQKKAFELGYRWVKSGLEISYLDSKYLFFDNRKNITCLLSNKESFFIDEPFKEITLKDILG